jgi:hypothetical protein
LRAVLGYEQTSEPTEIAKGKPFEQVADKRSDCPGSGGNLGCFGHLRNIEQQLLSEKKQALVEAYAPPLVIEVLSPLNKSEEIHRQRAAAFSGGTREFWVVDLAARTVEGLPAR